MKTSFADKVFFLLWCSYVVDCNPEWNLGRFNISLLILHPSKFHITNLEICRSLMMHFFQFAFIIEDTIRLLLKALTVEDIIDLSTWKATGFMDEIMTNLFHSWMKFCSFLNGVLRTSFGL
jgi:hypothetical protein